MFADIVCLYMFSTYETSKLEINLWVRRSDAAALTHCVKTAPQTATPHVSRKYVLLL